MSTKPVVLIVSFLLAAGGGAGLYFGTSLFERDPVRAFGDPVPLEPLDASAVTEVNGTAADELEGRAAADMESAAAPGVGAAARNGARLASAPPAVAQAAVTDDAVEAAGIEASSGADRSGDELAALRQYTADTLPLRQVRRWKTSYAIKEDAAPAGAAERPPALSLATPSLQRAPDTRAPLHEPGLALARGDVQVAEVGAAEAAAAPPAARHAWKTSYALDEAAQSAADADALEAPRKLPPPARDTPGAPAPAYAPSPTADLGVARTLEMPDTVQADSAASATMRRWKTSFALDAEITAARAFAAVPAAHPPDGPTLLPPAPIIAIERVEVESPGRVIVAGQADPWSSIRVYLNDEPFGDARSEEAGGWLLTGAGDLPPGRHVVRADMIDDEGLVEASAEMRFDRVRVVMADEPAPAQAADHAMPEVAAADPAAEAVRLDDITIADERAAGPTMVHIERGDTLWHIARAIYGLGSRYTVIFEANRNAIRNPDLIFPGQTFTVPILH